MSLSQQLTQLARNVGALTADTNAIFEALRAKGVNVPANAQLSDVADMIEEIEVPPSSVEIGGRSYPVVKIGNKHWLAENLDLTWTGLGMGGGASVISTQHAWYYNNQQAQMKSDKYNLMYNWYALNYLESNKSTLLPSGWRVPTKEDFEVLITDLGGSDAAGTKMKTSTWNGDNSSGLSVLPGGFMDAKGSTGFNLIGDLCYLWSITELSSSSEHAYALYLSTSNPSVSWGGDWKTSANYVRLTKD